jgi:hypothetical protein
MQTDWKRVVDGIYRGVVDQLTVAAVGVCDGEFIREGSRLA